MKERKDRLTILFICNMDGSEKHAVVIGKSKNPRCFRSGEQPPLQYHANTKAWMTGKIWTEILRWFDRKIGEQGRRVVMFVDNAPCHKLECETVLSNVTIRFLPANTTCVIQSLDMGIIRSFKAKYLEIITRKRLALIETGVSPQEIEKEINVRVGIELCKDAWNGVTQTTIRNCFKKAWGAGIVEKAMGLAFEEVSEEIHPVIAGIIGEEPPCFGELTDEDIVNEVCRGQEEEDVVVEEQPPPTKRAALVGLSQVRRFLESIGADVTWVKTMEEQILRFTEEQILEEIGSLYNQ